MLLCELINVRNSMNDEILYSCDKFIEFLKSTGYEQTQFGIPTSLNPGVYDFTNYTATKKLPEDE